MSNSIPPVRAASSAPEDQPSTPSKPAPRKRKVARKITAQAELDEARQRIKAAQEDEKRALAKVERQAKEVRAKKGHDCVPDLVARLDPTLREKVIARLLGVARPEERQSVQDWVEILGTEKP